MATLNEAFTKEDLRPIIVFQTTGSEIYNLRDSIFTETLPPDLPSDRKAEMLKKIRRWTKLQGESRVFDFSLEDVYRAVEKSRAIIYTVVPDFRFSIGAKSSN